MNEKHLKRKLILKRKKIRNKLIFLKHGELLQERMFNPINKHLKSIESKLQMKTESTDKGPSVASNSTSETELKIPRRLSMKFVQPISTLQDDDVDDDDDDYDDGDVKQPTEEVITTQDTETETATRIEDIAKRAYKDYLEQYHPLPKKYINDMYNDESKQFDHKYGVKLDKSTEKFKIGDSYLDIDGSDVIIKNKRYRGTSGLYELLFKKYPQSYTTQDEENYIQIVLKTNAHRRHYKANQQIDGNKMWKYKTIIAPHVNAKLN